MNKSVIFVFAAFCFLSCSRTPQSAVAGEPQAEPSKLEVIPLIVDGKPTQAFPRTVVFKMNGDWSNYVPVNVNSSGSMLVSYPDPRDISGASIPLPLDDGWWLDRRGGMGVNTRFTRYTWDEYSRLPRVPDQQVLLKSIIPSARVTETLMLDIPVGEATVEKCNELLQKQTISVTLP